MEGNLGVVIMNTDGAPAVCWSPDGGKARSPGEPMVFGTVEEASAVREVLQGIFDRNEADPFDEAAVLRRLNEVLGSLWQIIRHVADKKPGPSFTVEKREVEEILSVKYRSVHGSNWYQFLINQTRDAGSDVPWDVYDHGDELRFEKKAE